MKLSKEPVGKLERRITLVKSDSSRAAHNSMLFFDSVLWVFKGMSDSEWSLASADDADVVVAHHETDPQQLQQWRSAGKFVVIISTDPAFSDVDAAADKFLLQVPFKSAEALQLLARIDSLLSAGKKGTQPGESSGSEARNSPVNSLTVLEVLRMLRHSAAATHWMLGNINEQQIWVRGDGRQYRCPAHLVEAIRRGAGCSALVSAGLKTPPAGLESRPGFELVWFLAYHTTTLITELSPTASYRLQRWPDFGLVRTSDDVSTVTQMRIVAALDVMPATLAELSFRASALPAETICTLNALWASDCIEPMRVVTNAPAAKKVSVPRSVGGGFKDFLRGIRKHLGIGVTS